MTAHAIVLARYGRIVDLAGKLVADKFRLEAGEVLVSTELVRDLEATVGDRITIPNGSARANDGDRFQIVGKVDLGNRELSWREVFLSPYVA